jgi:hypothetical protein
MQNKKNSWALPSLYVSNSIVLPINGLNKNRQQDQLNRCTDVTITRVFSKKIILFPVKALKKLLFVSNQVTQYFS